MNAERDLLAEAIAGDDLAIQRLLVRHHDRLVEFIAFRMPAAQRGTLSAGDICQEAYIAAIRNIASFKPDTEDAFHAWLCTIAQRKLTDAFRAKHAAKRDGGRIAVNFGAYDTSSVVALIELVAVHERTPSRSAARHEAVEAMQRALRELPDEYRDVVRLRYVEALTAAETGRRMGRSEGAVRMLCMRALKELGDLVGDPVRFFSSAG